MATGKSKTSGKVLKIHNAESQFFQIKITLSDIQPPIWRTVLVPANIALDYLHTVIQVAMGWRGGHMHLFEKLGRTFAATDFEDDFDGEDLNEAEYLLKDVLSKGKKGSLRYIYDLGDGWDHEIILEETINMEQKNARCLDGARACPPEDVGGVPGYEDFCEIISNPKHPEYHAMLDWYGKSYDPEKFDVHECNKALAQINLKTKKRGKPFIRELE